MKICVVQERNDKKVLLRWYISMGDMIISKGTEAQKLHDRLVAMKPLPGQMVKWVEDITSEGNIKRIATMEVMDIK